MLIVCGKKTLKYQRKYVIKCDKTGEHLISDLSNHMK